MTIEIVYGHILVVDALIACFLFYSDIPRGDWKSHATLTLLATQDCPLWLQYD